MADKWMDAAVDTNWQLMEAERGTNENPCMHKSFSEGGYERCALSVGGPYRGTGWVKLRSRMGREILFVAVTGA